MNHFIIKFPPEETILFSEAKSYFDEMQGTESWFPVPNQSTCLINACQYLDCHFCSEWVWLLLLSFFFLLIKNDTRQKGEQRFRRKRALIGTRALNRIIIVQLMPIFTPCVPRESFRMFLVFMDPFHKWLLV